HDQRGRSRRTTTAPVLSDYRSPRPPADAGCPPCGCRALRRARAGATSTWPWIGALVTCLVFAPHIAWNAHHQWVPIRFQLHRGFDETNESGVALARRLPSAEHPGAAERTLGRWFKPWSPQSDMFRPSCKTSLGSRIAGYGMAVLLMCGAFLVPIVDLPPRPPPGRPGGPAGSDPPGRRRWAAPRLAPPPSFP